MGYIYDLHKRLMDENLILVYEGEFTQEITKSVLAMAERNMNVLGEISTIRKKVFNIMIECLQNLVKHSSKSSIFMIGKHEDDYIIGSGNPVTKEEAATIAEKINYVNGLNRDELRSLFREIVKIGELSDKGGAGLGFIDMVRKSGEKLLFDFQAVDEDMTFFSLLLRVRRGNFDYLV